MEVGVQLLVMLIGGAIVAAIANGKGRSPVGWFFIGFIAPCIGLILVLVLPDLKAQARRLDKERSERRRLREQLRQERMKTQAYQRHVSARLDAHDDHLGIDTRSTPALQEGHGFHAPAASLAAGGSPDQPLAGAAASSAAGSTVKEWFYERGGESRGPVSEAAIRTGLQNGKVDGTTLVWREGMANWQALAEVPTFAADFRG